MKKVLVGLFASALVLFNSGCVTMMQQATNTVSIENADMSKIKSYKHGEACINNVLFLFSWGDRLISNAAAKGKIKKVLFVEDQIRSYVVYNEFCTVVYGE